MTEDELDLDRAGRADLLDEVKRLRRLNAQANENLSAVQEICTKQLEELRTLRVSNNLPGWRCSACHAFNGSAKYTLTECRCCGTPR